MKVKTHHPRNSFYYECAGTPVRNIAHSNILVKNFSHVMDASEKKILWYVEMPFTSAN